jgi:hypothetical protein
VKKIDILSNKSDNNLKNNINNLKIYKNYREYCLMKKDD